MAKLKDSGKRREFGTGAVRDIQEGKGRCDLMPLDVIAEDVHWTDDVRNVFGNIYRFQQTGNFKYLFRALFYFNRQAWNNAETMYLELAKHFEDGAKKYGVDNWRHGIPAHCYINSAVRHYLKWLRGDMDEPHDRAFVWNIVCCIWTCLNKPEMNDYGKGIKNK